MEDALVQSAGAKVRVIWHCREPPTNQGKEDMSDTTDMQNSCAIVGVADAAGDRLLADIVTACEAEVSTDDYCAMRAAGVTHGEALEITTITPQVGGYLEARGAGVTHGECVKAGRSNMPLAAVANAVRKGCSFTELYQVSRDGDPGVGMFVRLWEAGADVEEILWAHRRYPRPLTYYIALREAGVTRSEVVQVVRRRLDEDIYRELRTGGVCHRKAMRVARKISRAGGERDITAARCRAYLSTPALAGGDWRAVGSAGGGVGKGRGDRGVEVAGEPNLYYGWVDGWVGGGALRGVDGQVPG
jgi:hypothetical protein